ncbi:MAG: nicotinate (nicotinamide) nucleotide adenylyltransferase [Acidobacteriota bacterium]
MKIGILGGSFDPIHSAHVYIGLRLSEILRLDQVWFVVANIPPHKDKRTVTGAFHRYAMTVLALQEHRGLLASTWELEREGPSFTIETLESMKSNWPGDRFCFIAGSDSLRDLHSWKDYGKLLLDNCCVFVQRPGSEVNVAELPLAQPLKEVIRPICSETHHEIQAGRSFLINLDPPPVSSTAIREAFASGRALSLDCLSPAVLEYITKHRLYEDNPGSS